MAILERDIITASGKKPVRNTAGGIKRFLSALARAAGGIDANAGSRQAVADQETKQPGIMVRKGNRFV